MDPTIQRLSPSHPTEAFLIDSCDVLEVMATGGRLDEIAEKLVAVVAKHVRASMVTLLQVDEELSTLSLVAPSRNVPAEYLDMLQEAPVGPFGTCARAAYDGHVVIHPVNAETDDWAEVRDLIDRFGFRASWSFPLFAPDGTLVGTLGLYFGEYREPSEGERDVVIRAAHLGGLLLSQHRERLARRWSERRFRDLIESIPEGVVELDGRGAVTFASARAASLATVDEPIGRQLAELYGLSPTREAALLREEPMRIELNGRWLHLRGKTTSHGAVIAVRDATEERSMQDRLVHADRMASLGTLAAGVAHEINNPLMAITANLEGLADLVGTRADTAGLIEDAQVGASRIATVTGDLLSIARAPEEATGLAQLDAVVEQTLRLGRHRFRHTVSVEQRLPEDLPLIDMPPVHLGQVLMNLFINSAQAFEDPHPSRCHLYVEAEHQDGRVIVRIRDDGPGMAPSVAARVFDPFFTTKSQEEGTGLGLAIVRGLVERSEGSISLDTSPGEGCTFSLYLRSAEADGDADGERISFVPSSLRVLFVDDEPPLLRSVERMLSARGHSVVCETSGSDALERLEEDRAFDVVLIDLMMPVMDGAALATAIEERYPEVAERIVFVSGGAISKRARQVLMDADDRWLRKPFQPIDVERVAVLVDDA